jgi:hypothetical protein
MCNVSQLLLGCRQMVGHPAVRVYHSPRPAVAMTCGRRPGGGRSRRRRPAPISRPTATLGGQAADSRLMFREVQHTHAQMAVLVLVWCLW